jgi:SAM-dependent methyltransferase
MDRKEDSGDRDMLFDLKKAQALAFGPLLFHAACLLRDRGVLRILSRRRAEGMTAKQVAEECGFSPYAATVLLEAGLAAELLNQAAGRFVVTRVGKLFDSEPMTRVNTNFVRDVCYRPAQHLGDSLDQGRPSGLRELGPWSTLYEGLSELPEPARTSWFEFDHFYSDEAFSRVLVSIQSLAPQRVLDIGGNTGKFALALLTSDPTLRVTIADLPGQLAMCRKNLSEAGHLDRVDFWEVSLLDAKATLPEGHDFIWMSQFLCCFDEAQILSILRRARNALAPGGSIMILENLWDQQENEVGPLCLQATSLYFATVANGNSRMYESVTFRRLIEEAELSIQRESHHIGWGHSMFECVPRG